MADNSGMAAGSSSTAKGKKRVMRQRSDTNSSGKKIKADSQDGRYDATSRWSAGSSVFDQSLPSDSDEEEAVLKSSLESLDVEEAAEDILDAEAGLDFEPLPAVDEKPFRLMDLPAEIRIEIYRACLTRPFDILLSKLLPVHPPSPDKNKKKNSDASADDETAVNEEGESAAWSPLALSQPTDSAGFASSSISTSSRPGPSHAQSSSQAISDTSIQAAPTRVRRRVRDYRHSRMRGSLSTQPTSSITIRHRSRSRRRSSRGSFGPRPQDTDPLLVTLLRVSKLIYKESRPILYGENAFILDLDTALYTLGALHQRSRGQIRNLHLTIPNHNEILERFAEVVRLSLRYCWRLQKFVINMPFTLPGADGSGKSGNTAVYANAFDILRWLPRQCEVVLEGNVCEEIRAVVQRNANLAKNLDELAYARRQLISNDTDRPQTAEGTNSPLGQC